jgi:DNA-binding transcriptional ArsR family regulator
MPARCRSSRRLSGEPMTEYSAACEVAELLAAVSEPTRLKVLFQLTKGPMCVGALADAVDIRMVNMSHHLGVMRLSGVLKDERDGRNMIYSLNPKYYAPGTTPDVIGTLTLGQFRIVLWANPVSPPATGSHKRRKYAKRKRKPRARTADAAPPS